MSGGPARRHVPRAAVLPRTPRLTVVAATVARVTLVAAGGCGRTAAPARGLSDRIDRSLAAAARYLASEQSPDGAWRSRTYGLFRGGPSLTPHVLTAAYFLRDADPAAADSFRRGAAYFSTLIGPDGRPRAQLRLPVYTAAAGSWLARLGPAAGAGGPGAQAAWVDLLHRHRLAARLGWRPADLDFGGWGYALDPPQRPEDPADIDGAATGSNLSATVWGLGALRAAGRTPADDPAFAEALRFVYRCQNHPPDGEAPDAGFDDGGFFFRPGDPTMNKAGGAGTDRAGRSRFRSYGSATADGLRCLLRAGLPRDHPRVRAARRWLEHNFDPDRHPGAFPPDREGLRHALYFYYCWSVSHAFLHLGTREVRTGGGDGVPVRWAEAMADALLARQSPDGSWANAYADSREDDPLIATPFAAAALLICRRILGPAGAGTAYPPDHRPPP